MASPNKPVSISFLEHIETSRGYKSINISKFGVLDSETSSNYCDNYSIDGMDLVVSPVVESGVCTYEYIVTADGIDSKKSLIRVGISEGGESSNVLKYSATTALGKKVEIDVNAGVPAGYVVDESSIIVLGSGNVETSLLGENKLFYLAGENISDSGITRIHFNFINKENASIILATIDVSISKIDENHSPIAFNFRHGDPSSFVPGSQLDYQPVLADEEVIIDISRYFNEGYVDAKNKLIEMKKHDGSYFYDENNNKVFFYLDPQTGVTSPRFEESFFLIDPDKQHVQLTDVFAYNSFVSPVDNNDFNSTSFRFKSSKEGLHYVTYVLSDHDGGYATGIIEILVGSKKPWASRLTSSKSTYLSPLEYNEVKSSSIPHSGVSREDGFDGPLGFNTALFSYSQASAFCSSYGLDLPTVADFTSLKNDFPQGLYLSKNKFSPVIGDRNKNVSWPATSYYWSKSATAGAATIVSLSDYSTVDSVSTVGASERYAVTCISRGRIESVSASINNQLVLPFSDKTFGQLDVKIVDNEGNPVSGALVYGVSDQDTFITLVNNGVTNAQGIASLRISSRRVGTSVIEVHSGFDTKQGLLNFLQIPKYVRVGASSQLCYYDTIELMAEGDCNYATIKSPVNYNGYVSDSFFVDDLYAYRQGWGYLYKVVSLSAAANPQIITTPVLVGRYQFRRYGIWLC